MKRNAMNKKINPHDNEANQNNRNKGTSGTNLQFDQAQGNRGKQLNPNQQKVTNRKPPLIETLPPDVVASIIKKCTINP